MILYLHNNWQCFNWETRVFIPYNELFYGARAPRGLRGIPYLLILYNFTQYMLDIVDDLVYYMCENTFDMMLTASL